MEWCQTGTAQTSHVFAFYSSRLSSSCRTDACNLQSLRIMWSKKLLGISPSAFDEGLVLNIYIPYTIYNNPLIRKWLSARSVLHHSGEVVSKEKHATTTCSLETLMEHPCVNSNYVESRIKQLTSNFCSWRFRTKRTSHNLNHVLITYALLSYSKQLKYSSFVVFRRWWLDQRGLLFSHSPLAR